VSARPVLLVGAGEQARKALVDDPAMHGRDLDGIPVLGGTHLVHQLPDAALLACDPDAVDRLGLPLNRWVCVR
jgi:hypothetical protein